MVTVYERVLKRIRNVDPAKAAIIEEVIQKWRLGAGDGPMVIRNLENDLRLTDKAMEAILNTFYKNRAKSLKDIKGGFKTTCYPNIHKGKKIDFALVGPIIGGAKAKSDFVGAIKELYPLFGKDRIRRIFAAIDGIPYATLHNEDKNLAIAKYSCWATWSEAGTDDPFDFATSPNRLLKILANLGLDHRQLGQKHYLLIYEKNKVKTLRYPTIADAQLYSYFAPSSEKDYCGRTYPWQPSDYQRFWGMKSYEATARPEAVHKPIKLDDLILPLKHA